ncbi:unnamed protein product [Dibothriocephalus latus]|uniref:Uncharacterized protein n=1 Tax=Dibothriocephalus latus TaxID=60516 RepID=A0A3P7NP71_DIBLA|nr:unnamed protein product [Dibothriocephalus latus]
MYWETNPEFLDIEAEFTKNLNYLIAQKKNRFKKVDIQSGNAFLAPERVPSEVIVNKTDESLHATPSFDTIPSKMEPFTVKTTHLRSIQEENSLAESGFETSDNSPTDFSANVKDTTKLHYSKSFCDTRSHFVISNENVPPADDLVFKPPDFDVIEFPSVTPDVHLSTNVHNAKLQEKCKLK